MKIDQSLVDINAKGTWLDFNKLLPVQRVFFSGYAQKRLKHLQGPSSGIDRPKYPSSILTLQFRKVY